MSERADIIIVGAGSAGCVLAHELVVRRALRVTLVEPESAGASAADRQRPARWLNLVGSADDWDVPTETCQELSGRALRWPRGRGLGGSSRINSMIWFPPTAADYRRLVDAGGQRWRFEELRCSAQRARCLAQPESPRWLSEASQRFLQAAQAVPGAEPTAYQRTTRDGRRWTPAALLDHLDQPSGRRRGPPGDSRGAPLGGRLRIVRGVVDRLIWRGDAAVGIEMVRAGSRCSVSAERGVVLSAGAVGTPAILMRSGIGPAETLRALGTEVRVASEAVGENLRDHLTMPVVFSLAARSKFRSEWSTRELAQWQHLGGGRLSSNIAEAGGLFDQRRVQIHVTPTHYLMHPRPDAPPAMTLGVSLTQPASRGRVSLRSVNPHAPPVIDAGYLSQPADLETTIAAVRLARSISQQTPLAGWIGSESVPGVKRNSDAQIARAIRRYAQTLYHPVGTCALGDDRSAAVDASFRVRGAEHLWVVDASVLPAITVGNPNAMVMALAAYAAAAVPPG